jgi:hypothetical protein
LDASSPLVAAALGVSGRSLTETRRAPGAAVKIATRRPSAVGRGTSAGTALARAVQDDSGQVLEKIKAELREIKGYPVGERFCRFHERHRRGQAGWVRPLMWFAVAISLVIGVILAFIPGPAILFFAISAALAATQSHAVAKRFDRAELATRKLLRSLRKKRRQA